MARMHADEVDTDASLVRRLLAAQFPQWADLPIEPVPSAGTDNALYRLGDDMAVRLPRIALGRRAGGEGARVAAETRPAPAACHPCPAREGDTRRGLPLALVRLPVARRRERDDRAHRRSTPGGDGSGAIHRRPAADRSHRRAAARAAQLLPRRAAGHARRCHPRRDRRPGRHARYRRGDRGVGSGPPGARLARPARLDPRRPAIREPAGRTRAGSAPSSTSAVWAWAIPPAT